MINLDFSLVVTILYIAILYLFMKRVFFRPITKILESRRQLIAGRMEEAQKRIREVESRTAEYEQTLKSVRSEIYKHQETEHEQALAQKAELVANAKAEAERVVQEGRARLAAQAHAARNALELEVNALAKELTSNILTS
jgi:F-type H+-transporting ATPase subunit b